jgi:hypothetical protein
MVFGVDNMLYINYLSITNRVPVASERVPVASKCVRVASELVPVRTQQGKMGSNVVTCLIIRLPGVMPALGSPAYFGDTT